MRGVLLLSSTKATTKDNLKSYLWFRSSEEQHGEQHYSAEDPQAELMHWHYRLGHLPFLRLKLLRRWGDSKMIDESDSSSLCWLSIRSNNKGSMAYKSVRLSPSTKWEKPRLAWLLSWWGVWLIDTVPPQCCGSFLASLVHVFHDESFVKVDSCCKKSPWTFCYQQRGRIQKCRYQTCWQGMHQSPQQHSVPTVLRLRTPNH